MKGKSNAYFLWPFGEKLIFFSIVAQSTIRDSTVGELKNANSILNTATSLSYQ